MRNDNVVAARTEELATMKHFILFFIFIIIFWLRLVFFRILVPQPGIEPVPLAVKAWNPNHWTAREFPILP